jgi:hypothetical protein
MARSILAAIQGWLLDRKMESSVVKEERCPARIRPERRRTRKASLPFNPLQSMNEATHCGILVKSRKKGKRNLPVFSIILGGQGKARQNAKSLNGGGFAPHVQDVYVLWHAFGFWKGEFSGFCSDCLFCPRKGS